MMGNTMTAARPRRERHLWTHILILAAMASGALGLAGPSRSATTERIVVDRNSGLAISGFDPVAYFTDAQALQGKGEFEQVVGGAVWRFRNAGNRAAFMADPEVYAPRYGGYDPIDVARGVAVAGNPLLWVINGERLYFFYRAERRDEFVHDRDRVISTADRQWPEIRRLLVP
jgi:hypothetical protein